MGISNYRFSGTVGDYLGKFSESFMNDWTSGYLHHSSFHRGYASVDHSGKADCYRYNGRFGSGVIRIVHHTTQHVLVQYWIFK